MNSTTEILYRNSHRLVSQVSMKFKRELLGRINWNSRLIGIKGPKGVGKSTMLKQHIREAFPDDSNVLYVSLDNMWFANSSLAELVEYHYTHGGTHLFLDEVHKYDHWQTYIKNIYDDYPTMNVVFTGSSMLKLNQGEADLSRRASMYTMDGLSFREYLMFEDILHAEKISLEDVLTHHVQIATDISEKIHILPHLNNYYKYGYYPFYKEDLESYHSKLIDVVQQTIENDIPAIDKVEYATVQKLKKLMAIIARQVPLIPKMDDLYNQLETSREQGLKLLNLLERGALLGQLKTRAKAVKQMSAPEKLFLDNPNLMYAFNTSPEIGTIRETFFYNQTCRTQELNSPPKGDFLVNGKYSVEVGGADKSFNQIKDVPDSFLAIDDVEFGRGNKIPLWLFGFLY
ncbi:MAG: AAA family ATPase [Bacteroidaceae bacterium]|nr:AAA family ATPase [Bacteroidaceae bacterium]